VLEYGDEDDVAWMRRSFGRDQILDVLRTDRHLTPLSANFWALYFGVPPADSMVHVFKALTYFGDAEHQPMPDMLVSVDWQEVKTFFTREVPHLL